MANSCVKEGGRESIFICLYMYKETRVGFIGSSYWKLFEDGCKLGNLEGRGGRETFTI